MIELFFFPPLIPKKNKQKKPSPYSAVKHDSNVSYSFYSPAPSSRVSDKKLWDKMSHCRTNYRLTLAVMNLLSVCADKRHE